MSIWSSLRLGSDLTAYSDEYGDGSQDLVVDVATTGAGLGLTRLAIWDKYDVGGVDAECYLTLEGAKELRSRLDEAITRYEKS